MKYYTGIGSRKTPPDVLDFMTKIAEYLYNDNYYLRSGGADGADSAFEKGAGDLKEIYIPWKGFNHSASEFYTIPSEAFTIAESIHPNWDACSRGARMLHARNIQQVLGQTLDNPSDFVICWTPDGKIVGGTATAIKLAQQNDIKVYNLGNEEDYKLIEQTIRS